MANANLQRVREVIAAAPEEMIDMSVTGNPGCGSPGCIVGWALTLFPLPADTQLEDMFIETYEVLGLNKDQGDNLTLALLPIPLLAQQEITKAEVLTAIDSLLVDPERVMPEWPERVVTTIENWS